MKENLGKYVRSGTPETKKFNMYRDMIYQNKILMNGLVWPLATLRTKVCQAKIKKVRMDNIKGPFILVCNHNAFYDFYVMLSAIKPHTGVFPAAVDDFIGREIFLRLGGCLPKRKYTSDLNTVRQCQKAIQDGECFGVYAEARY